MHTLHLAYPKPPSLPPTAFPFRSTGTPQRLPLTFTTCSPKSLDGSARPTRSWQMVRRAPECKCPPTHCRTGVRAQQPTATAQLTPRRRRPRRRCLPARWPSLCDWWLTQRRPRSSKRTMPVTHGCGGSGGKPRPSGGNADGTAARAKRGAGANAPAHRAVDLARVARWPPPPRLRHKR